jgi:hypothetical protein
MQKTLSLNGVQWSKRSEEMILQKESDKKSNGGYKDPRQAMRPKDIS